MNVKRKKVDAHHYGQLSEISQAPIAGMWCFNKSFGGLLMWDFSAGLTPSIGEQQEAAKHKIKDIPDLLPRQGGTYLSLPDHLAYLAFISLC